MSEFFIKLATELFGPKYTQDAPYLARSMFYRKLVEIERSRHKP